MKSRQSDEQKGRKPARGKSDASRTASGPRREPVAAHSEGERMDARLDVTDLPDNISESEFRSRVARKAFELYEGRGGESGNEIEDWIQAERLVREELVRANPRDPA